MKKFTAIMTLVFALIGSAVFSSSAAEPDKNGVYEVPIQLMHAEKDTASMGDSYIIHTALLEIEDGVKYITIVSDSSVMNLEFSYYTDGSVTGNTASAEKVKNVEIDGKTYSVGYRFPLKGSGQLVGVKFKASIMPVSPSARVYIDYEKSVMVSSYEETTAATASVPSTSVPEAKPAETQGAQASSSSSVSAEITEKNNGAQTESQIDSESEFVNESTDRIEGEISQSEESTSPALGQEESTNKGLAAGIITAAVIIAGACVGIIIKAKIKKHNYS